MSLRNLVGAIGILMEILGGSKLLITIIYKQPITFEDTIASACMIVGGGLALFCGDSWANRESISGFIKADIANIIHTLGSVILAVFYLFPGNSKLYALIISLSCFLLHYYIKYTNRKRAKSEQDKK